MINMTTDWRFADAALRPLTDAELGAVTGGAYGGGAKTTRKEQVKAAEEGATAAQVLYWIFFGVS